MEQKLVIYVERQLGYAHSWKNNSKTVESSEMRAYIARTIAALETKAFAAVEFFCETQIAQEIVIVVLCNSMEMEKCL